MREHMGLYRGKRIDNGEWVEGNLIVFRRNVDDEYWCIVQMPTGYGAFEAYKFTYEVDPNTVGEYVGRLDKNNNPIFEGDIVDASNEWWYAAGPAGHTSPLIAVLWDEGCCCFEPFGLYDCDCGVYISARNCKVIGNIYDNPELWEDEH